MHTAYFPSFELFRSYCRTENSVLFDLNEQYKRQTPRNHCLISTANGLLKLSVPVTRPNGGSSVTSSILVDDSKKWRLEHWRSLEAAYQHAPYFEHYRSDIHNIIFNSDKYLIDFNLSFMTFMTYHLNLGSLDRKNDSLVEFQPDPNIRDLAPQNLDYQRVFYDKEFVKPESLSVLDGLFNLGPMLRRFI